MPDPQEMLARGDWVVLHRASPILTAPLLYWLVMLSCRSVSAVPARPYHPAVHGTILVVYHRRRIRGTSAFGGSCCSRSPWGFVGMAAC